MRFVLLGILALLPVLAAAPARAQWIPAMGSRCRTRSWNCGGICRICAARWVRPAARRWARGNLPMRPPPGGGNDMVASLLDRVSRLEDEMRGMNGRLDEMNNALQQQHDDLAKQIGDLSFRLDSAGVPGGASVAAPRRRLAPRRLAAPGRSLAIPTQPGYPPASAWLSAIDEPAAGQLGAIPAPPVAPPPVAPPPARFVARLSWRCSKAMPRWRGGTTRRPRPRRARCWPAPRGPRAIDAQFLLAQALNGKRDYANAAVAFDDCLQPVPHRAACAGFAAGAGQFADLAGRQARGLRLAGQAEGGIPESLARICASRSPALASARDVPDRPGGMTGGAIAAAEFGAAMAPLGPFEPAPHLAVAVSGGADSMALAVLAADWAALRAGQVIALVVDHGLRAESRAEAELSRARLDALGIPSELLVLTGLRAGPGLAARARTARHEVLRAACARRGILHLLLGHHAADQAETIAMRMLARTGPAGLAGMAALVEVAAVRLLRPLLAMPPVRLRATLRARGIGWVEDPSNQTRRRSGRGCGRCAGMRMARGR